MNPKQQRANELEIQLDNDSASSRIMAILSKLPISAVGRKIRLSVPSASQKPHNGQPSQAHHCIRYFLNPILRNDTFFFVMP